MPAIIKSLRPRLVRLIFLVNPHKLWRRYLFGFALIGLLLLVAERLSHLTITQMERDANALNITGQQRMLSQRILLLTLEHGDAPRAELDPALPAALDKLAANHAWITENAIITPALEAHYRDRDAGNLDAKTMALISAVRAVVNSYPEDRAPLRDLLITQVRDDLLADYHRAVTLYEEAAIARLQQLQNVRFGAMVISFVVIGIEGLLIFYPAQVAVRRAFGRSARRVAHLNDLNRTMKRQNTALEDAREDLHRAAHHDALTGLHNRRALHQHLEDLLNHPPSGPGESPTLGVIQIDLDNFKPVNDSFGHAAGDIVLQRVAKVLNRETRGDDFVARLGGDEFVIVLKKPHGEKDVTALAHRILGHLARYSDETEETIPVGASFGYAMGRRGHDTPDQVLHDADDALYVAKRAGRNTLRFATDPSAPAAGRTGTGG